MLARLIIQANKWDKIRRLLGLRGSGDVSNLRGGGNPGVIRFVDAGAGRAANVEQSGNGNEEAQGSDLFHDSSICKLMVDRVLSAKTHCAETGFARWYFGNGFVTRNASGLVRRAEN